jgi:deoxyribonuclease V
MISSLHAWNVSSQEALRIQRRLQSQLLIQPLQHEIHYIGGADISFNRGSDRLHAGIILLDYHTLKPVAHSLVQTEAPFPYVPGLLSFREIPALLEAWEQLELHPDVVMLDGHGIAHPRRLGVASHFGLWVDKPSLGCAKKLLTGLHESPGNEAPSKSIIYDNNDRLGFALRSRTNVKPVYLSPGHLLDHESTLHISLHCLTGYRIPEPTRLAHQLVNRLRRGELKAGFSYC